eukprot:1318451-Amorphochlora_amoeboformis.AAC.1
MIAGYAYHPSKKYAQRCTMKWESSLSGSIFSHFISTFCGEILIMTCRERRDREKEGGREGKRERAREREEREEKESKMGRTIQRISKQTRPWDGTEAILERSLELLEKAPFRRAKIFRASGLLTHGALCQKQGR